MNRRSSESHGTGAASAGTAVGMRLDKWLVYARFLKTRSQAAALCSGGRIRCRGQRIAKPDHAIRPGDVLTFPLGRHIRVIKVLGLGQCRGTPAEARSLYEDLEPPSAETALPVAANPAGRQR